MLIYTYFNKIELVCISLRGEVWADKATFTPPPFIGVPVTSHESERSSICVLAVSILTLSMILLYDFDSFYDFTLILTLSMTLL
jgi:hypothetical protein